MAEFSLILPLLLLLVFGIIEAGRLLLIYSAAVSASNEAARYGASIGSMPGGTEHFKDCEGIRDAAQRVGSLSAIADLDIDIRYDNPSTGYSYPYCPPDDVSLGDRIIVSVLIRYRPIVPLVPIPPIEIVSESRRTIISQVVIE